jgi:hypothetical protein
VSLCAAVTATDSPRKSQSFFSNHNRIPVLQRYRAQSHAARRGCDRRRIAFATLRPYHTASQPPTAAAAVGALSRRLLRCKHRLCVWSSMCVFKRVCMLTAIDRLVCLLLGDLPCRDCLFSPRLVKMSRFNFKIVLLGEGRVGKTSLVLR